MNPCEAIVYNQTDNNMAVGSLRAADNPAYDGPDGLFAIMVKQGSTETIYYVHKDYLGSISAITDATGNLVESLSYDAWGRRRKATDWTDYNVTSTLFDRGFTGHEHLPQFGLINMNGRVYDPFLARFLSPDPFVQAPGYTQSYNRYSYAFNNPLRFVDPSGYLNGYPDEGIPTEHMDGGSGATFHPSSMANNWYAWATNPTAMTAHHHSNAHRSEAMNFMYLSTSAYNSLYGQGASRLIYDVWQDPDKRAQWLSGQISLQKGFWVQYTRQEGKSKWFGFSSTNRLAGVEVINKFVKFNGTSGRVDGTNSLLEYGKYGLTGMGTLNSFRGLLEWEYFRQARYNRRISGNFNQPIKHYLRPIMKIGQGLSIFSAAVSVGEFAYYSTGDWGSYGKMGIGLLSAGLTYTPEPITTTIGIGIGLVDVFGGFNGFYNWLDDQQMLYENFGVLMLPRPFGPF